MEYMFRKNKLKEAHSQIASWEANKAGVSLTEGGRVQRVGNEPPLLKNAEVTSKHPARQRHGGSWPSLYVCVKGHRLFPHLGVIVQQTSGLAAPQCPGLERRAGKVTILGSRSQKYFLSWALFSRENSIMKIPAIIMKRATVMFPSARYVPGAVSDGSVIFPP